MAEVIITTSSPAVIAVTTSQFVDRTSVCADGSVTLNGGDTIADDIPSGDVKDISVHDSTGSDVGSTSGGGLVTIADGSVTLGDGGDEIIGVEAEATKIITVSRGGTDITADSTTDGAGNIAVPSQVILNTANPIKTGQTTSYATGDDGDVEAGRLTNFITLDSANVFGNTNRFTDELGNQVFSGGVYIDWSSYNQVSKTVIGYTIDRITFGDWSSAVLNCNAYSIGSYTSGWRLPNIRELLAIYSYEDGFNWDDSIPNLNIYKNDLWSSTTRFDLTTQAYYMQNSFGRILTNNKSLTVNYIACRTFTWNESVLI